MCGNRKVFLLAILALIFSVVSSSAAQLQPTGAVPGDPAQSTMREQVLDFRVINRKTKEPLSDVSLEIQINAENKEIEKSWKDKTDLQGLCRIKLPDSQIKTLRIYPRKEGFVPLFIFLRSEPTPLEIPKTLTAAMEPGTTIGGIVQNEQGEPIEGVTVGVHYQTADPAAVDNIYVDILLHTPLTNVKTNKEGRWRFDTMPAEIDKNELRIFLTHLNYLSDNLSPGLIPLPVTPQPPIAKLRDLSSVMVMKKGFVITGKITDGQGNPVSGAKIYEAEDYWFRLKEPFAETDSQGLFRSNPSKTKAGGSTLTVQAAGYAPDLKVVTIKPDMSPLEFRLEPGRTIQGNVTDQAGKPVEGASIYARRWRGQRGRLHLEAKTDANGNFNIADAPVDEVVFDIGKQGYMLLENYAMKPREEKYNIKLKPILKVYGKVLDAKTGQPIDRFTVMHGIDFEDGRVPSWDKYDIRTFANGRYGIEFRQEIFTYRILVGAEGYQSAISDFIRPKQIPESSIAIDFNLDKAAHLAGIVLSPVCKPLSDAEVVIATHWLRIQNGNVASRSSEDNLILHTDTDGKFSFNPPVTTYVIVILHEQGYAMVTQDDFATSKTITASPWGRIEGTLRIGTKPGADEFIVFYPKSPLDMGQPRIAFEYETQVDKDGHFVLPKVFPSEGSVTRAMPINERARRYSHTIDVEVKPGQTTRVQIGGTGRPVVGKVVIPDNIKDKFDWQYADYSLRINSPQSPYRVLGIKFEADGSFRADDVPAGDYCLYLNAYEPPANPQAFRREQIGLLSHPFNVPDMPGGQSDELLDLGMLELEVVWGLARAPSLIGKPLPRFEVIKTDFAPEQTQGKIILVCFWDMNQRPSRNCLLQLSTTAQELKAKTWLLLRCRPQRLMRTPLRRG